ncbi:hypothetical protein Asera_04910 [Actinocatenispora sera]|uniref:Uncharacterized protein n=1 Tax=Actinocatenispora sera TaxID=390989 RepID=A0A810KT34_9ACTN|nr:hypothetical protein Asera_04910 [Actinocatenispora sera]
MSGNVNAVKIASGMMDNATRARPGSAAAAAYSAAGPARSGAILGLVGGSAPPGALAGRVRAR